MESKDFKILSRDGLKLLALLFMLLDHMWATIIPGNQWMTYLGRLAFPIFAYQIVEGFVHTSDFKKYAKRLFIFALISEIPFNLFVNSSLIYPFHQNVLFTLLLGLLAIRGLDKYRKEQTGKNLFLAVISLFVSLLLATIGFTDYAAMGVLTVVFFYLTRDLPYARFFQLLAMVYLNIYSFQGFYIPIEIYGRTFEFQTQGFAIFSLIPISLYNGKKGRGGQLMKYAVYIFYPLHLLILAAIFRFS